MSICKASESGESKQSADKSRGMRRTEKVAAVPLARRDLPC